MTTSWFGYFFSNLTRSGISWMQLIQHKVQKSKMTILPRRSLSRIGLSTPIQPVPLGSAGTALAAQRALADAGFWVAAIRPPTVPQGSARLRVTLSAAHSEEQIDALIAALAEICRAPPDGLSRRAASPFLAC